MVIPLIWLFIKKVWTQFDLQGSDPVIALAGTRFQLDSQFCCGNLIHSFAVAACFEAGWLKSMNLALWTKQRRATGSRLIPFSHSHFFFIDSYLLALKLVTSGQTIDWRHNVGESDLRKASPPLAHTLLLSPSHFCSNTGFWHDTKTCEPETKTRHHKQLFLFQGISKSQGWVRTLVLSFPSGHKLVPFGFHASLRIQLVLNKLEIIQNCWYEYVLPPPAILHEHCLSRTLVLGQGSSRDAMQPYPTDPIAFSCGLCHHTLPGGKCCIRIRPS